MDHKAIIMASSFPPSLKPNCPCVGSCLVEEEIKVDKAPAPVKKEVPVPVETKAQDGAAPPATTSTSGKKKNSAKKQKTEHGKDDVDLLILQVNQSQSRFRHCSKLLAESKTNLTLPFFLNVFIYL